MAGYFSVGGFRTLGTAATPQNLMTIENIDATKLVYIRRIVVQLDATAVLVSVMPQVNASNANTIIRCGTASDGGAATAITSTAGTTLWQQYCMRMHTVVGQVLGVDNNVAPGLVDTQNLILRQNQALLIQVVASAGASNPATNHWFCNIVWEED